MRKTIKVATIALLTFAGFSADAFAQPSTPKNKGDICHAANKKQKETIDALAKAWNKAGLQDLFANNGCPGVIVTITKRVVKKGDEGSKIISGLCSFRTGPQPAFEPVELNCQADPL